MLRFRKRRRVDGTRMQSSCLELEKRKRDEGTRIQNSCLELEEERRRVEKQRCRAFV